MAFNGIGTPRSRFHLTDCRRPSNATRRTVHGSARQRTGVPCSGEIACSPQFLEGDRGSSRSAQTMAPKTRVLEACAQQQETVMLSGRIEDAVAEVVPAPTWAHEPPPRNARLDWKAVDRALRSIRRRRAALDAEEARLLRDAEGLQIWRPLGMVSMLDYLERVLGYAPRTAQDRLRVARALGDLPRLTAALTAGELAFSAVRELTRVATPATEAAWVAAAQDK